jgi:hypothetical protein
VEIENFIAVSDNPGSVEIFTGTAIMAANFYPALGGPEGALERIAA